MSNIEFEFKHPKAMEAILYIANSDKVTDTTFMRVLKLLYLADKTSLESWGRFIFGDTYYAMKHGPVPTNAYDIMKDARDEDAYHSDFEVSGGYTIQPNRKANIEKLSESDTECLDQVIASYGRLPVWQLRDITHDDAYKVIWAAAGEDGSTPIPLERIISEFDDADELLDYLQHAHEE